MQKKNWTRPQLQVLTRGKLEEKVLVVCKGNNIVIAMQSNDTKCYIICNNFKCDTVLVS